MEMGILQITVLKGPKNGEILVCKPGSKHQIGRVMKGNDFALRDPGISQKHLCFKFDSKTSRWFVSDLDSSNGTILNGSKIQSSVPVPISDHDVISIGEKTQLGVRIVPLVLLEEKKDENGDVNVRKVNTRRGLARINTTAGPSRGSEKEVVKEDESKVERGGRNNALVKSTRVLAEEGKMEENLEQDVGPDLMPKAAQKGKVRGQRKKDAKDSSDSILEEKMKENRDSVLFSPVLMEDPDKMGGVQLRRNPRRGNSSKALKEVDTNRAVDVGIEAKGVPMKRKERRKGREAGITEDELHSRNDELFLETDNCDSDSFIMSNEGKGFKARTGVNSSIITEEEKGGEDIGVKEGLEVNCNDVGDHFENMTLQQWFDSMFIFLPKVIHDETEQIINILKEKAKKYNELVEADGNV